MSPRRPSRTGVRRRATQSSAMTHRGPRSRKQRSRESDMLLSPSATPSGQSHAPSIDPPLAPIASSHRRSSVMSQGSGSGAIAAAVVSTDESHPAHHAWNVTGLACVCGSIDDDAGCVNAAIEAVVQGLCAAFDTRRALLSHHVVAIAPVRAIASKLLLKQHTAELIVQPVSLVQANELAIAVHLSNLDNRIRNDLLSLRTVQCIESNGKQRVREIQVLWFALLAADERLPGLVEIHTSETLRIEQALKFNARTVMSWPGVTMAHVSTVRQKDAQALATVPQTCLAVYVRHKGYVWGGGDVNAIPSSISWRLPEGEVECMVDVRQSPYLSHHYYDARTEWLSASRIVFPGVAVRLMVENDDGGELTARRDGPAIRLTQTVGAIATGSSDNGPLYGFVTSAHGVALLSALAELRLYEEDITRFVDIPAFVLLDYLKFLRQSRGSEQIADLPFRVVALLQVDAGDARTVQIATCDVRNGMCCYYGLMESRPDDASDDFGVDAAFFAFDMNSLAQHDIKVSTQFQDPNPMESPTWTCARKYTSLIGNRAGSELDGDTCAWSDTGGDVLPPVGEPVRVQDGHGVASGCPVIKVGQASHVTVGRMSCGHLLVNMSDSIVVTRMERLRHIDGPRGLFGVVTRSGGYAFARDGDSGGLVCAAPWLTSRGTLADARFLPVGLHTMEVSPSPFTGRPASRYLFCAIGPVAEALGVSVTCDDSSLPESIRYVDPGEGSTRCAIL